jgi:hypothetical protein
MRAPAAPKPTSLLRDFTDALAQQMFYWGRDVIHPDGNLLVAHGFERRSSPGLQGTSCYRMPLAEGYIELHGACAGWYPDRLGSPAFLYIRNRHRCYLYDGLAPPAPGSYTAGLLRSSPACQRLKLSRRFLAWWLDYEDWISTTSSPRYRHACHSAFAKLPKSRPWLPPDQDLRWLRSYLQDPSKTSRA